MNINQARKVGHFGNASLFPGNSVISNNMESWKAQVNSTGVVQKDLITWLSYAGHIPIELIGGMGKGGH